MRTNSTTQSLQALLAHSDWVNRLAYRVVADPHDRDEVVQRTWLSAVQHSPTQLRDPKAWLSTVLRNAWRRLKREESLRAVRETEGPEPVEALTPNEVVEQATLHRQVVDAVLELDDPYRSTLLQYYFQGLSHREIARREAVSVETVRTRLKRGRARLRGCLEARFGGDPRALSVVLLPLWSRAVDGASGVGASLSSLWIGGVIMSAKVKLAAALVAVIVALFLLWSIDDPATTSDPAPASVVEEGLTDVTTPAATLDADEGVEELRPAAVASVEPEASDAVVATEREGAIQPGSCHLTGQVFDVDGSPVEGALVLLGDPTGYNNLRSATTLGWGAAGLLDGDVPEGVRSTSSDSSGAFEFDSVDVGDQWSVAAIHREKGIVVLPGVPVTEELSPVNVELHFEGGLALYGTVTDPDGQPAEGVQVSVAGHRKTVDGWTGTSVATVRTDENGEYQVFPLAYPRLQVSAYSKEFCTARGELIKLDEEPTTAPDMRVDLQLEAKIQITGSLVDEDGNRARLLETVIPKLTEEYNPDGRQIVVCGSWQDPREVPSFDPQSHHTRGVVSIEEGTYELSSCDNDADYVSVWADGKLLGMSPVKEGEGGPEITIDPTPLDNREATDGILSLRVLDAESREPLVGFELALTSLRTLLDSNAQPKVHVVNDEAGSFEKDRLRYGYYRVVVKADGYAPYRRIHKVGDPATADDVEILLGRPTAQVRVKVVDKKGEPIHDAHLYLCHADGGPALLGYKTNATNLDGDFVFEKVAPGEYLVVVDKEGYAAAAQWVETGDDSTVEIEVERGIRVNFRPNPGLGFSLRILDSEGVALHDDRRTGTSRFGGAQARLLAGERYTIEIYCRGFEVKRHTFEAQDEEAVKFDLVKLKTE